MDQIVLVFVDVWRVRQCVDLLMGAALMDCVDQVGLVRHYVSQVRNGIIRQS